MHFSRKGKKLTVLFALALAAFTLTATPAQALLEKGRYSEEEKVGFAFYRLGRMIPDFSKWTANKQNFGHLRPKERNNMVRQEKFRLERGFSSYAPAEDLLVLTTKVNVHNYGMEKGYGHIGISILEGEGFFIPVDVGGFWVAVVPEQMEELSNIFLKEEEYHHFLKNIGMPSGNNVTGTLQYYLKPVAADAKSPVVIEDTPFWPLLSEVGSMSIWDNDMSSFVWSYEAPWFNFSDRESGILDLYDE